LTQTVFLRLLKYKTSFSQSQSFKSWIYGVSRNVLNSHFQAKKVYLQNLVIYSQLPDNEKSESENDEKLYRTINMLPDDYKELIVLSKFQGLKYKEIAEMFSTTESSIKNKIFRALDKLRDIYFRTE
jgi:RNA polymerase sigma-70 factor (ECF subfamily)